MTLRDAFIAGYAPSAASLYFSSLLLLAETSRIADSDLVARIGDESDRVVLLRDGALAEVERAGGALCRLSVEPPDRPAQADSYSGWAEAVFEAVNATLPPGSAEAVAHLLGHVLGEGMATVDALAVLSRLREVAPDHVLLLLQAESLEHERATAQRRMGRLAAHPLLPAAAQLEVASAAHDMVGGTAGALAGRAQAIESALS